MNKKELINELHSAEIYLYEVTQGKEEHVLKMCEAIIKAIEIIKNEKR
jgi:hypothetical protein